MPGFYFKIRNLSSYISKYKNFYAEISIYHYDNDRAHPLNDLMPGKFIFCFFPASYLPSFPANLFLCFFVPLCPGG